MSDLFEKIARDFDKKNEIPEVKVDMEKLNKFAKDTLDSMEKVFASNPFSEFEKIAKDIRERQDNAAAMEFTRVIGEMLKENGVTPKLTEVKIGGTFDKDKNIIAEKYGVYFECLDFSEHDKVFEDKIISLQKRVDYYDGAMKELRTRCCEGAEKHFDKRMYGCLSISTCRDDEVDKLKRKIAELEQKLQETEEKTVDLPYEPIEVANYLINHQMHVDAVLFLPERDVNTFSVDELKQIAEHLLVYCEHNKEVEE